jgi:glycosyltransferase involved in cell wall biosynthesis
MRHGLPVIASKQDAGQEINVDGQTGFNIDLTRPAELPDRLIRLLSDPGLAATLGANGRRRWAEYFRYSAFERRFSHILTNSLLRVRPRRSSSNRPDDESDLRPERTPPFGISFRVPT